MTRPREGEKKVRPVCLAVAAGCDLVLLILAVLLLAFLANSYPPVSDGVRGITKDAMSRLTDFLVVMLVCIAILLLVAMASLTYSVALFLPLKSTERIRNIISKEVEFNK